MAILKFTKKKAGSDPVSGSKKQEEVIGGKAETVKEKTKQKPQSAKPLNGQDSLLDLQALVTEKSVALQEEGFVVFRVPEKTTKMQVKHAVRTKFKTEPIIIRSMRMSPKKRRRGQTVGRTAAWKKVYVKVKDVQKLISGP